MVGVVGVVWCGVVGVVWCGKCGRCRVVGVVAVMW